MLILGLLGMYFDAAVFVKIIKIGCSHTVFALKCTVLDQTRIKTRIELWVTLTEIAHRDSYFGNQSLCEQIINTIVILY